MWTTTGIPRPGPSSNWVGRRARVLPDDVNVNQAMIVCHPKKLGMVWKLARWVSHELSDKVERGHIFSDWLQRIEQAPFLRNLVMGDESWLISKTSKEKGLRAAERFSRRNIKICLLKGSYLGCMVIFFQKRYIVGIPGRKSPKYRSNYQLQKI